MKQISSGPLLYIVRKSLENWSHDYVLLSDSVISLCWVTNEEKRLSIFHRNRVNQIKLNTDVTKLMHVRSEFNPGDRGTKPDKVLDDDVGPDSIWERGLPWMRESLEKAIDEDIIKPATELSTANTTDEEEYDRGFLVEKDLEILVRGHNAEQYSVFSAERVDKMVERAAAADYLFMPKFSFKKVVSITALVFKFIAKLKFRRFESLDRKAKLLPVNVVSQFTGLSWTSDKVGDHDRAGTNSDTVVTLSDKDVTRALVHWYSKATVEVKKFIKPATLSKIAVEKDGILFCRTRILDSQRFLNAGEFDDDNIGQDLGISLLTPLIEKYSAIALSIAQYIHHDVAKHAGAETCYRVSLEYCHIVQGPGLFRELGEECVKCHMYRKRYIDVAMGPVSDHQLAMTPPFYCAYLDLDGPYTSYVPGFERETRNRKCLATKNYIMTFVCPINKLVNLQVIEAKNSQAVCEGLTRLGCEVGFPKYLVLDRETSFMKVVREAEINLQDLSLRTFREYGIKVEVSPVAAHNFSGLVERKIKTVQEAFEKIDLKNQRLHATGLQTLAKLVENHLNNLPLGFSYGREATNTPLLRIITPNMLRLGRLNSRALSGPVKLPRGPKEMMSKVESIYEAFFKIWNIVMIPRLIPQPKWYKSSPDVKVDDVIYFQKVENDISSEWTVGQVESVTRSKDGKVRRVQVRYSNYGENVVRFTDRSVRSLVRLFNVEDDYFVRDMESAEKLINELQRDQISDDDYRVDGQASIATVEPCQCCCSGHCSVSKHTGAGRVTGVSLVSCVKVTCDHSWIYSAEIVSQDDVRIVPDMLGGERDEFYEMLTALEIKFEDEN